MHDLPDACNLILSWTHLWCMSVCMGKNKTLLCRRYNLTREKKIIHSRFFSRNGMLLRSELIPLCWGSPRLKLYSIFCSEYNGFSWVEHILGINFYLNDRFIPARSKNISFFHIISSLESALYLRRVKMRPWLCPNKCIIVSI